jgi:predicted DNA-binding transcriptional regulator AlpA
MPDESLVDTGEAARILGCTKAAVTLWRRERRGPNYVRLGRLIRYRRSDLFTWIESRLIQQNEEEAQLASAD